MILHYYRSVSAFVEYDRVAVHTLLRDRWSSSDPIVKPKRLMLEMAHLFEDTETTYGSLPYHWDIA